jgi:methionyl aminopeptidase
MFTIEPMFNADGRETKHVPDDWTIVSKDRTLSDQWENIVAFTSEGYEVLSAWPGRTGAYPLA